LNKYAYPWVPIDLGSEIQQLMKFAARLHDLFG